MKLPNCNSKLGWGIVLSTLLLSACLETKDRDDVLGNNKYRGGTTNTGNPATVVSPPQPVDKSTLGVVNHHTPQPPFQGASQRQRVALVIGNAAYEVDYLKLANPTNDAQDLAGALKKLGFTVIHKENISTRQELETILQTLATQLQDAELGLFFYAGHGMQYQGENYLIPTHIQIPSPEAKNTLQPIIEQSVSIDTVLAALEETNIPTKVIILDACRNNPFQGGLAPMQSKARYGGGTFIAYSTQPNSKAADGKGRNSPYTESLLQFLDQPNLPIEMLFKKVATAVSEKTAKGHEGPQIPWVSTALLGGDLCLAGCFSTTASGTNNSGSYCTTKVGEGLYQGQCQNGLPQGQGVMKYQSGEYYQGSFSQGLRHGPGIQYLPDGTEIAGSFCNGRLCN